MWSVMLIGVKLISTILLLKETWHSDQNNFYSYLLNGRTVESKQNT